jgi:hypothetical protein
MKKIFLAGLLAAGITGEIQAQAKQQRVLLQQIAALQVYIGYAQRGYAVAKKGLNAIGDFKNAEVRLHADYLGALTKVNPKIKKYARVAEIMVLELKIIKTCQRLYRQIQQDDLFHGDEVDYIKRVLDRLIENGGYKTDELLAVLSDGQLQMGDDQRIRRIDRIYKGMLDDYSFCEYFGNQAQLLALARAKELKDAKTGRVLHGLNTARP